MAEHIFNGILFYSSDSGILMIEGENIRDYIMDFFRRMDGHKVETQFSPHICIEKTETGDKKIIFPTHFCSPLFELPGMPLKNMDQDMNETLTALNHRHVILKITDTELSLKPQNSDQ